MKQKVLTVILIFSFAILCGYDKSPYVSEELWMEVQPYLLPERHPAKKKLDKIFNKVRATLSPEAMKSAGFKCKLRQPNHLVAAKHRLLKGYLVKVFMDSQTMIPEEEAYFWIHRIKGAHLIRDSINRHKYNAIMKVPQKWIYPLPKNPPLPDGDYFRRNFILVVEDMQILNDDKNTRYYRKKMTPELLEALYTMLTENVLIDSIYINNIPFSYDGRIAFIDTEHYLTDIKPLRLHRLTYRFSKKMQYYWEKLIQ